MFAKSMLIMILAVILASSDSIQMMIPCENKTVTVSEEETLIEEASVEEDYAEEDYVEEAFTEEVLEEERYVEEVPAEESPVEEVLPEESPVEESPVEEVPAEKSSVEEVSTEEVYIEEDGEEKLRAPLLAAVSGVVTGSILTCTTSVTSDNENKICTFTLTATSSATLSPSPKWFIIADDYSLTNDDIKGTSLSLTKPYYQKQFTSGTSGTGSVSSPKMVIDGSNVAFCSLLSYNCYYSGKNLYMSISMKNPVSGITGIGLASYASGNYRVESPRTGFGVSDAIEETLSDPVRNYDLTIVERLPVGQILAEYGNPTFRCEIENNDTGKISYVSVTLTNNSPQTGGCYTGSTTLNLCAGDYTVTPLDLNRYEASATAADVALTGNLQVNVTRSITTYDRFSHMAVLNGL